jgi:hypothetical protein
MQWFIKEPNETLIRSMDYTGKLASGVTLVSSILSATNKATGANVSATLLVSTTGIVNVTDETVSFIVVNGTHNTDYEIKITTTVSSGDVYVDCITLIVRNC